MYCTGEIWLLADSHLMTLPLFRNADKLKCDYVYNRTRKTKNIFFYQQILQELKLLFGFLFVIF